MKKHLVIFSLVASITVPAFANDQVEGTPSPSLSDFGRIFKNALSEEETRLLIEYMRDSVLAAFNDEEVALPPDLAFKLEVLMQRLKKESNYYLDNFLKQLEADITRSLKEKMEVPPTVPYQPPSAPLLVPTMKMPDTPPASLAPPPSSPAGYVQTPWGYVPWFYVPPANYAAPAYVPPPLPQFAAPAVANQPSN